MLDAAAAVEADPTPVVSHRLWTNVLSRHVRPDVIRGITCNVVNYVSVHHSTRISYMQMIFNRIHSGRESYLLSTKHTSHDVFPFSVFIFRNRKSRGKLG